MTVVEQRSYSRNCGSTSQRGGDVDPVEALAQALGDRALVRGLQVGEEQADRDRLDPELRRLAGDPVELGRFERLDHAAGTDPLAGLDAVLRRHEGLGQGRAEVVQAGPVLSADLEQVGEPARGDQRRPRAAPLEQGVGAHGHPVGERLDVTG